MESIFISMLKQTNKYCLASALKLAYFTTHRVGILGTACHLVSDWEFFKNTKTKFKKILLLGGNDEEFIETARRSYSLLDSLNQKKYLSPDELRLKAVAVSVLKELEEAYAKMMKSFVHRYNLNFYYELQNGGESVCCGNLSHDQPGDPLFGNRGMAAHIIMKVGQPGETPDVFWLEPEFFDPQYEWNVKWVTHPSEFVENSDQAQLLALFDVPSTSQLTATAAKHANRELRPEANSWNEAMDPFLDFYLRKKGPKPDAEVFNAMVESSRNLGHAFARSGILKNVSEYEESAFYHPFQLILGFIPSPMLWKFYQAHNGLTETTMDMLEQYKSDPEYLSHQPVFILKSRRDDYFESKETGSNADFPEEIKAVKKSIDL